MNKKTQLGMSALMLLVVLVIASFLLTCFFKLWPVYLDNWSISGALKSMGEQHSSDLHQLSKTSIRSELSKFYTINNIRGEAAKSLEVVRQKDYTLVIVAYEVRVPMFANIDVMLSFNNVLDSRKPEECCSASDKK